jgi:hypothetical protein
MKFTVFETNSNGSEKYSSAEMIWAVSPQKAAESYQEEFRLAAQTSHLKVITEGGTQELIALRGVSPPTVAEVSPAFTAVNHETPSPIDEETCGWSTFCTVIGWINLLLGVIGLFIVVLGGGSSDRANGLVLIITGFAGGLSSFIFGYIIQLLFDCRRYLRRMTEK